MLYMAIYKRNNYRRYRRGRKKLVAKSAKIVPKRIKNNTSTYRIILMGWNSLATAAGGLGGYSDLAYCYPLNFPLRYVITGSTFGLMPNIPTSYDRIRLQFNEYRVTNFELIVIPDGMDTKTNSAIPDIADAPSICYIYKDSENYAPPSSEVQMLNAGTMPTQFTYHKRLRYTYRNPDKTWMSTRDINISPTTPLSAETDMSGPDTFRSLKAYFPRLQYAAVGGSTYFYGRMYAKWHVEARGVRID